MKERELKKKEEMDKVRNVQIRFNKVKYGFKLTGHEWKLIDLLAESFGESRDGFISRLLNIIMFHKVHPVLKHFEDADISNIRNALIEICSVYKNESSTSANQIYGMLNNFLTDKIDAIRTNKELLDSRRLVIKSEIILGNEIVKTIKEKNIKAEVTIYFRNFYYDENEDPLILMINLCLKHGVEVSQFVKDIYWNFCIINEIINLSDIELLETKNPDVELVISEKILKKGFYPEFKLSPNLFTQLCLFKEANFNFSFLRQKSKRASAKKKKEKKHTVNFLINDIEGRLIHYTLPVFCIKFDRTLNEMMKLILFLYFKRSGIINNHFELQEDSEKILLELLEYYRQS